MVDNNSIAAINITSITVGGKDVIGATPLNPVVIVTANGTLTVTGYNESTGAVNYRYTDNGEAKSNSSAGTVN